MTKKILVIAFFLFYSICNTFAQLPTPLHAFTFDSTLSNTTNSVTFVPVIPLTGTTWGYNQDRFGAANKCFASTHDGYRTLTTVISNLPVGNSSRTISFWVNFYDFPQTSTIFSYGTAQNNQAYGLTQSNGLLSNFGINNDVTFNLSTSTSTWYFYTLVHNGTSTSVYRNGQLVGTQTKTWNTIGTTFNIGSTPNGNSSYFKGSIDDLQIFNVALTQAQVTSLHLSQLGVNQTSIANGMLAYYGFNGNTNAADGVHNLTTWAGTPNFPTGKYGSNCVSFNGSTALRNTTLTTAITGNNFSIAFWQKRAANNFNYSTVFELFNSLFYRHTFVSPTFYELGVSAIAANNTSQWVSNTGVPRPTQSVWEHMLLTYEKNGTNDGLLNLYQNGTKIAFLQLPTNTNINRINNYFVIGGGSNLNGVIEGSKYYYGEIDEVYVFNRKISDVEIQYLMLSPETIALPTKLNNFNASINNQTTLLKWSSSNEINTSHFDVEYSTNGYEFERVATVKAKGNSSDLQHYDASHFIGNQPLNFYRLKMIDKDGLFTYSNILKLENKATRNDFSFSAMPSIGSGKLNANLSSKKQEIVTLQVINLNGVIVYTQKLNVLKGTNSFLVDISNQPKGMYLLKVNSEQGFAMQKIIKQ